MKRHRSPQEKKRISYQKDCRNSYGENDKSSRKAIPRRKKMVNQSYRRAIQQKLSSCSKKNSQQYSDTDLDSGIKEIKRKKWKKEPDIPLAIYVQKQLTRRLKTLIIK